MKPQTGVGSQNRKKMLQKPCRKAGFSVVSQEKNMDDLLLRCAVAFEHLIDYQYRFILGLVFAKRIFTILRDSTS